MSENDDRAFGGALFGYVSILIISIPLYSMSLKLRVWSQQNIAILT